VLSCYVVHHIRELTQSHGPSVQSANSRFANPGLPAGRMKNMKQVGMVRVNKKPALAVNKMFQSLTPFLEGVPFLVHNRPALLRSPKGT
jgi:hypothetical protein